MIFAISKFIAGLFGIDVTKVQKAVLLIVMVLAFCVILIPVVFIYKACNKPPSLNEKQIQRAEQAVKERNDKALKEVLAESDTRVDNIDSNIKQAEENTRQSEKSYDGWTVEQLQAEYDRRKNQ